MLPHCQRDAFWIQRNVTLLKFLHAYAAKSPFGRKMAKLPTEIPEERKEVKSPLSFILPIFHPLASLPHRNPVMRAH